MRIKRIKIDNYKAINEMKINLDPQLNLFIGKNGCGKSTVSEAFAKAINFAKDKKHPEHKGQRQLETGLIDSEAVTVGRFRTKIHINYTIKNSSTYATISSNIADCATNIDTLLDDFNYLPYKNYDAAREAYPDTYTPNANVLSEIENNAAPVKDFLYKCTYFNDFYAWLKERENTEYQEIRKVWSNNKNQSIPANVKDRQLDIVTSAIYNCTGFKNIFAHGNNGKIEVVKPTKRGDVTLTTDQLSIGELNYICLVGDIAVKQMRSFDGMENPLTGEGVYIIDELEKHLHPEWQRTILARLQKIFPNCQFIITTNSPLIISSVKSPTQIYVLEDGANGITFSHPDASYGLPEPTVLEDIMGEQSRTTQTRNKFEELYASIARKNVPKAQRILEELSLEIPFDSELNQAKALITEIDLKNNSFLPELDF